MDLVKLGLLLKNYRKSLNLSLREASQLLNLSHNYISMLEKAKDPKSNMPIKPTIETLRLISKGYDLDINILLDLSGYDFKISDISKPNNLDLDILEGVKDLDDESKKQVKEYIRLLKLSEKDKNKKSYLLQDIN